MICVMNYGLVVASSNTSVRGSCIVVFSGLEFRSALRHVTLSLSGSLLLSCCYCCWMFKICWDTIVLIAVLIIKRICFSYHMLCQLPFILVFLLSTDRIMCACLYFHGYCVFSHLFK